MKILYLTAILTILSASCEKPDVNTKRAANQPQTVSTATPIPTASVPKNGDYVGRGKVTKINNELGSVELDHEEISDVMPKMTMEFFVTDKAMLKNVKVGDQADFTLRYKDGQETITAISKAK